MRLTHAIFMSYARTDVPVALRIYDTLAVAGHEVWLDAYDLRPGVDWWAAARRAIDQCTSVLFLVSPESSRSFWCGQELAYAASRGKQIVRFHADRAPSGFGG